MHCFEKAVCLCRKIIMNDIVKQTKKKSKTAFLLLCFIGLLLVKPHIAYAQSNQVDSLKHLAQFEKNDSAKVFAYLELSKYYKYINSDSAIFYATEGYNLSKTAKCLNCEALSLHYLCVNYWIKENYSVSLSYCLKSLQINEALHNKKGMSYNYNLLGIIYSDQHYDSLAKEYYNKALAYAIAANDSIQMARILGNIGSIYETNNQLDIALSYYKKALMISTLRKDQANISTNLDYLGNINYKKGNLKEAIEYYQKAIDLAILMNDNQNISNSAVSLAKIYFENKQLTKCLYYANYALKSAQKISYFSNIQKSSTFLYEISSQRKDFESALKYYILLNNAKDSLNNNASEKQFRKMQQEYELDKKQKQIIILSKDKLLAEQETKNQFLYTLIFAIGSGLLILLAVFIFRSYTKERNAKKILTLQKAEIIEINEELSALNEEVTVQRDLLAKQRKNTTDSIRYARRIQNAMLPPPNIYKNFFPDSFIYNRPKDIVSGDFYWFHGETQTKNNEIHDIIYFALADCTGHGVPGAFMSILCYNIIDLAMEENIGANTSLLLTSITNMITKKLRHQSDDFQVNDGLDIAICTYNKTTNVLSYSGINNPIFIIRNHQLIEIKPDRASKSVVNQETTLYTAQEFILQEGDSLFLFSDGYADQFNDDNKIKFSKKRFKELLIEIVDLPNPEQAEKLHHTFENWKGDSEQIDDVMVLGIRI